MTRESYLICILHIKQWKWKSKTLTDIWDFFYSGIGEEGEILARENGKWCWCKTTWTNSFEGCKSKRFSKTSRPHKTGNYLFINNMETTMIIHWEYHRDCSHIILITGFTFTNVISVYEHTHSWVSFLSMVRCTWYNLDDKISH